jgi:hypothetical protein
MPATRADMVQLAVKLIGPKPEDRDRCEIEIKAAFDYVATKRRDLPFMFRRKSVAGKRAALRLQRALENLAKKLTDDELPDDVGLLIYRDRLANPLFPHLPTLTKSEVGAWLTDQIDRVAIVQKRGPSAFKIESEMKLVAATEAEELMGRFGQRISAKPRSRFCRLAALLYGHRDANLAFVCRKVRTASVQSGGSE